MFVCPKTESGLYRTKIKIGVDANGRDINKWISGKTKMELEQARREVISHYIDGTVLADDQLFGAYALDWYNLRKKPFVSASTCNNYKTMLNRHILPGFENRKMRTITAMDLQNFVNRFSGSSKSQITSVITTLQGIFTDAKRDRIIAVNPAENIRRPNATPPNEKRALTNDERARMIVLFPTHEYGSYLAVMYYTGMRPGEVRGLKWGDFDWDNNLIHVQRDVDYATKTATVGALKTAASDRFIPIAENLKSIMYPRKMEPEQFVFSGRNNKPLVQTKAIRMWIQLMVDCDMADPITEPPCYGGNDIRGMYRPRITPHTMHHNYITMCWKNGLDILITMKLVGHTDYQTTRNIYTHLSHAHLENAKNDLDSA